MVGLNTVFKQVFGEGLREHGFVKIKGRYPYIVRVVGDEIIHLITCRNVWCREQDCKAIQILGNWLSVYCPRIDLSRSISEMLNSLLTMGEFYQMTHFEYMLGLDQIKYKKEDEQSLRAAMEVALNETIKNMIPVFDGINSLETYIENCYLFLQPLIFNREEGEINISECTEALMYIQTDYHGDLTEKYQKMLERKIILHEGGDSISDERRKVLKENYKKAREETLSILNRIYENPEMHKAALEELKKRKERNVEALRSYGLNV